MRCVCGSESFVSDLCDRLIYILIRESDVLYLLLVEKFRPNLH
jgi:hypothetical protein